MITVVGEALIDLVVSADGAITATPGGAPYNVARACARLGAPVSLVAAVSTDRFGRQLMTGLTADGVATEHVQHTDWPSTLAVADLDADGAASYRFYLDGTSAAALTAAPSPPFTTALVAGGLGLAVEPMAAAVERMVVDATDDVARAGRPQLPSRRRPRPRPLSRPAVSGAGPGRRGQGERRGSRLHAPDDAGGGGRRATGDRAHAGRAPHRRRRGHEGPDGGGRTGGAGRRPPGRRHRSAPATGSPPASSPGGRRAVGPPPTSATSMRSVPAVEAAHEVAAVVLGRQGRRSAAPRRAAGRLGSAESGRIGRCSG